MNHCKSRQPLPPPPVLTLLHESDPTPPVLTLLHESHCGMYIAAHMSNTAE